MPCPTPEQLATLAIGFDDGNAYRSHVDSCAPCRSEVDKLRAVNHNLAAAHDELNHHHAASRDALLAHLPQIQLTKPRRSHWKQLAYSSLGVATAAAILMAVFLATSASPLSAMERIAKAVRDVKSFSCKLTNTNDFPPTDDKPARTLHDERFIYWRAPDEADQFGDMHGTTTISTVHHLPDGDAPPVELSDIVEIHPSGQRGILVDYLAKRFYRVPALHAHDIASSPPLLWLRAVRERAGKLIKDLGAREINGRRANGYLMSFETVDEFDDYEPVEVWIDPETDLPVEFHFRRAATKEAGITDEWSITDIEWNHDLNPKLFDTMAPAGYLDVTMPSDEKSISEITDALKLYAELSGGRYPHVEQLDDRHFATKFDASACYDDMVQLAGFEGPVRDEWASNPKFEQIQQSRAGLDALERILASYKWLIGYDNSVESDDSDKVLLWWNVARDSQGDEYRLIYGDLRTEIVSGEEWKRHVPPEIADFAE
jgi:hypothetical protein